MEFLRSATSRYRAVRSLPAVMIAAAAVIDFVTPQQDHYDAFLYVVPGLAAVAWGVWGTLAFGATSIAVLTVLEAHRGAPFLPTALSIVVLVGAITLVAAWSSGVRQRRERALRHMQEVADVTQRAVQHPLPEHLGCVDLHLLYETSVAGAHLGGDFYKALRVDGGVRLMVGDVQGKGLGAVEIAAVLLGSFRESAYTEADLPGIARKLEASARNYESRVGVENADRFATVVLVEIPAGSPVVRILSCGHPPPVRQSCGRAARYVELPQPSPPIHLPLPVDDHHIVEEMPFEVGDRMLVYTDGVSETRNSSGTFYPLVERVAAWRNAPDRDVLPNLAADLHRFSAHGLDDDTAAVLVVRTSLTDVGRGHAPAALTAGEPGL